MRERIKSGIKFSVVFLAGVIVGGILLESIEIKTRRTYKELIMTQLKVEQESMASKAARENRKLDAVLHRWATVNAESEDGFRIVRQVTDGIDDNSYLLPFQLLSLKMISSPEGIQKGKKIIEGIDRGKFASALDSIGQNEAALKQWEIAHRLMQRPSMEVTKKAVYSLVEQEKSELHRQADDAVLRMRQK